MTQSWTQSSPVCSLGTEAARPCGSLGEKLALLTETSMAEATLCKELGGDEKIRKMATSLFDNHAEEPGHRSTLRLE
jgi:hypothetical protein